MKQSDDIQRMLLLGHGQTEQMDVLAERHRGKLVQFICRMTRDYETAEDLAQEVLLSVYLAREHYQPAAEFTTWLYCIAVNRVRKWARGRRSFESIESLPPSSFRRIAETAGPNPERRLLQREAAGRVHSAILALPERQREAVRLQRFEECDYQEIAERMGTSVAAVKSILFRTHTALRKSLEEQVQPEPIARVY